MPPKKKQLSDGDEEETAALRNVTERRSLPSRSSRPVRAAMRDGSEEDDIINEVTTSPLEKVLRESIRTAKKEAGLKSDDDLPVNLMGPGPSTRPSSSRGVGGRRRGRLTKWEYVSTSAPSKSTTKQAEGSSRRANRNVYYGNPFADEEGTDADTESDNDSDDSRPRRRGRTEQKEETPKSRFDFKQLLVSVAAPVASSDAIPHRTSRTRQTESPKKKEVEAAEKPSTSRKPPPVVEGESSEEIIPIEKPEKATPKPKGKLNLELLDQKAKGRPRGGYTRSLVTTLPTRGVSSLRGALVKRVSARSVVSCERVIKGESTRPRRQLPQKNYDDTVRRTRRKAETDVDESSGFDSDRGSLPNIRITGKKKLLRRLSQTSAASLSVSTKEHQALRQMKKTLIKTDSEERKKPAPIKKIKSPARTTKTRPSKTDVEELEEHMEIRTKRLTKVTKIILKPTPRVVKPAAKVERKQTEGYESDGAIVNTRRGKSNAPVQSARPLRERLQVPYDDVQRQAPRKLRKERTAEERNKDEDKDEEESGEEEAEDEEQEEEDQEEDEEEDEEEPEEHIRARRSLPTINYDITQRRRPRKLINRSEDGSTSTEIIPAKKTRKTITPEKDEKGKPRSRVKKVEEPQSADSSESSESEKIRPRRVLPPVNYKPPLERQRRPKPLIESEESEESDEVSSEEKITARRTVTKVDYSDVKRRKPRKKPRSSDEEEEGEEVQMEMTRTRRQRLSTGQKVEVTRTTRSAAVTPQKQPEKRPIERQSTPESEVSDELDDDQPGPSRRIERQNKTQGDSSPEESSSLPSSFEEERSMGKKAKNPGPRGQRRPQSSVGQNNYFSGSSSDDERFDPKILEQAKQMVKQLYSPILAENEKNMEGEFKNFQAHLKTLPMKEYKIPSGAKPRGMNLFKEEIREGFETASVSGLPDVVPVHYLNTTPAWPKMKHWVHLEHNVRTKDSFRLSHIPYINDDHDSVSFVKELKKAYPEGIHGTTKGWGKHISDYLLYRLLKETIPKWGTTGHEMGYLYQAIFKLFPNKMTARQLQNIYPSLETRFDPQLKKPEEQNKKDDVGHSIRTLMCIKCRQYHCLLHGMTGEPFRMHRQPKPKRPVFQHPCSDDCYLYMPEVELNPPSSDEDEPFIKQKPKLVVKENPFTEHDDLFQKLIQINRHDPCQVTSMMKHWEKRTCQEVYVLMKKRNKPDREMSPDDIMIRKQTMKEAQSSFRNFTWNLGQGRVDNSEQHACKHKGPCGRTVKDCICGQRDTLCFKYCSCGIDCKMRFPGCRCQPGQCRTKQCQCFYAKWECDPDICKSCNCGPVANITKRPDVKMPELPSHLKYEGDDDIDWLEQDNMKLDDESIPTCSNVSLQRGNHKKLKVGKSDIAGYGCFIAEPCEKGEFIAEYTGEVITHDEAERRGMIYDEYKTSYIFALNKEYSVDATRMGNPIRFANHSDKDPNCYSQIIMVNGEHRIGIFAKRKLYPREELLFDYQYNKKWKAKYCPIVRGMGIRDKSISGSPKPGPSRKKK